MSRLIDLTNRRFGRLLVLHRCGSDKFRNARWLVSCDCGTETLAVGSDLVKGRINSCGCLHKEQLSARRKTHGNTCGGQTRLYRIWGAMRKRCRDPNVKQWKDYGGRGISVCPEWLADFEPFHDWALANGYRDDLTIDRHPDPDGNYEPSNCRWATRLEQASNRRPARLHPRILD